MSPSLNILEGGAFAAAGGIICFVLMWWKDRNLQEARRREADATIATARSEAEGIRQEARLSAHDEANKLRAQIEQSFAVRRQERADLEKRLAERETLINTQLERIVEAEKSLYREKEMSSSRSEELARREQNVAELTRTATEQLQARSGLSAEDARELYMKRIEQEASNEAQNLTRRVLEEARHCAEEKARLILSTAIHRYAGEHTFANTTASIALQGDDMKGRIIGREGRNIRAFEAATGVTVLIDDTPGAVTLSGFDPVRREIAKEAMLRLIADGRIHPTRIEEVVSTVTQEINETILRIGSEAVQKAGLPPMHPEIVSLLGKLHFRHSYSQNILEHSIEVAHLMALMAAELGIDILSAKKVGLLHDIGKSVNHEVEGPHAIIGADILRRCGEPDVVVNGVASHHADVPPNGPLGILVGAADAISASRPGARSESMTIHLKRVADLEQIANGFEGVEKSFAVQAGRELRVFVRPEALDDRQALLLAKNIVGRIQNDLQYPGQIKVTVIRETRCVEVAK